MKFKVFIPTRGISHNKIECFETKSLQTAKANARKLVIAEYESNDLLSIDVQAFKKLRWKELEQDIWQIKVPNSAIEIDGQLTDRYAELAVVTDTPPVQVEDKAATSWRTIARQVISLRWNTSDSWQAVELQAGISPKLSATLCRLTDYKTEILSFLTENRSELIERVGSEDFEAVQKFIQRRFGLLKNFTPDIVAQLGFQKDLLRENLPSVANGAEKQNDCVARAFQQAFDISYEHAVQEIEANIDRSIARDGVPFEIVNNLARSYNWEIICPPKKISLNELVRLTPELLKEKMIVGIDGHAYYAENGVIKDHSDFSGEIVLQITVPNDRASDIQQAIADGIKRQQDDLMTKLQDIVNERWFSSRVVNQKNYADKIGVPLDVLQLFVSTPEYIAAAEAMIRSYDDMEKWTKTVKQPITQIARRMFLSMDKIIAILADMNVSCIDM